jgi:uncharacterized membrane protein (DUF4010 family)
MLAAKWLSQISGDAGLFSLAAISGAADVDPITLSTAQAVGASMAAALGAGIILVAAGANIVAKIALAVVFGGIRFALPLVVTGVVAASVAGMVFALQMG